ncbi:hypothetical protein PInf_002631 [Phytophthora infestans]|nr:hypothetical protein PInf_002631 [Phytophthora infestans]
MAYGFTRSVEPSDLYCDVNETRPREYWDYETLNVAWGKAVQRRAILHAASAGELLDILKGNYAALDYPKIIGDRQADNQAAQEENRALTRRLDSLALSSVDLSTQLSSAQQQVSRLEAAATQSANLLASLRKAVALSEAKLARAIAAEQSKVDAALGQAQLHHQQVLDLDAEIDVLLRSIFERDAAFITLQGIAYKHFEQLQESVRLYSSTGTQPLRHAQSVIAEQRAVILRQKRLIRRNGIIPMHDPHMAAAAGGNLQVPGLDPSDLLLIPRLCRVLESRFPEVLNIPAGETRRLELISSVFGDFIGRLGCGSSQLSGGNDPG